MPKKRNYPHGDRGLCALGGDWFARVFDASKKVAVYWPNGPDSVTMVGYYDTVSDGNAAALAAVKGNGSYPSVQINYWHADITEHKDAGPDRNRDATADRPAWWDVDPAYQDHRT